MAATTVTFCNSTEPVLSYMYTVWVHTHRRSPVPFVRTSVSDTSVSSVFAWFSWRPSITNYFALPEFLSLALSSLQFHFVTVFVMFHSIPIVILLTLLALYVVCTLFLLLLLSTFVFHVAISSIIYISLHCFVLRSHLIREFDVDGDDDKRKKYLRFNVYYQRRA